MQQQPFQQQQQPSSQQGQHQQALTPQSNQQQQQALTPQSHPQQQQQASPYGQAQGPGSAGAATATGGPAGMMTGGGGHGQSAGSYQIGSGSGPTGVAVAGLQVHTSGSGFPSSSSLGGTGTMGMGSSGSSRAQQQQQHIATIYHQPLEKRIEPHGLPPQMLTGYERMSVEQLCTLGKELVQQLMIRMYSIVSTLKLNIKGDNKPNKPSVQGVDNVDTVRFQLEYSRLVFMALTEIRLRIDLKLTEQLGPDQTLLKDGHPSDADLLQMLSDPSPLEEDPKKTEMAKEFCQNRQRLNQLSCAAKKLEWLAMNSEPIKVRDNRRAPSSSSGHGRRSGGSGGGDGGGGSGMTRRS